MESPLARLSLRWKITGLVACATALTAVLVFALMRAGLSHPLLVAVAALVLVAASGGIAFFLGGVIVRPVVALRNVARSIAAGDLAAANQGRVAASGEVGELAESFYQAAHNLATF